MRLIYDVFLLSRNFYVYICFCVYMYQGFQFFFLINCLHGNKQFCTTLHLGIRYIVFSFDSKLGIILMHTTLLWVFRSVVLPSNNPWTMSYRFYDVVL